MTRLRSEFELSSAGTTKSELERSTMSIRVSIYFKVDMPL